jgi:hypothetical protein
MLPLTTWMKKFPTWQHTLCTALQLNKMGILDHKLLRLHPRSMTELYYPFQTCVCYSVSRMLKLCAQLDLIIKALAGHILQNYQSIGAQISILNYYNQLTTNHPLGNKQTEVETSSSLTEASKRASSPCHGCAATAPDAGTSRAAARGTSVSAPSGSASPDAPCAAATWVPWSPSRCRGRGCSPRPPPPSPPCTAQ